ncbi:hypothetical protein [Geotalea sp. SG265]|uniref:hypothetical protein n=1 Tax=Geotalea sp. SG265 TaxID=2922867 RepID=UPI001FAFD0C4|nr:hypothetical protein [Geotalea sp. SG265]
MDEIQVGRKRNRMGKGWEKSIRWLLAGWVIVVGLAVLSGCNRTIVPVNQDEYVEIDNPINLGNPAENPKVWVPKSSLVNGIPRGRELVRKGYEKVTAEAEQGGRAAAQPAGLRHRLLVAEVENLHLASVIRGQLAQSCVVRPVESQAIAQPSSGDEKTDLVTAAARQLGRGAVLIIDAPEGTDTGAVIKADLYDNRGPALIRSFTVRIPEPEKDESREEAVQRAVSGLAWAVQDSLSRTPWYAKVATVKGDRIYVDAGLTSGLKQGQRLAVYRGGEVISGLGFAHGNKITDFVVTDYVGLDGAFGITADATKAQPGDFVEPE